MDALRDLLEGGESDLVEFHLAPDAAKVSATVAAMLNGDGGQVFIGVDDGGTIHGLADGESARNRLERSLGKSVSPAASWSVTVDADISGPIGPLVRVDVPPGRSRPYVVDGRIFTRVGSASRIADASAVRRMIVDRAKSERRWEIQPAPGVEVADLDDAEIRRFVSEATAAGRFPGVDGDSDEVLSMMRLLDEGRLRRAAVVLFGSQPWPVFSQCTLRLGRFAGTTEDDPNDLRTVRGHVFRLLREAYEFVRQSTPAVVELSPGRLERRDRSLYPPLAVREALANAFCHRDYALHSGAVSVGVFDDRLEVRSAGLLPEGIEVGDLTGPHMSLPRNPLIADAFYRRGIIELWGGGTQRMVRECQAAEQAAPVFSERAGQFVVRFPSPTYRPPFAAGVDLSPRQRAIVAALRHGSLPFGTLKRDVAPDVSDSTLRNRLIELRDAGLVEVSGHGRGARWLLTRE